jgi:proteasome accessory factor B
MADKKAERLINLTLALLATKRYLKKQEIFRTVNGYEGEIASMERMFERDKSDLRELGIEIEVGDLDPLFDDEPGYRILQSNYSLKLPELTPREVAIFSVAGNLWNDSILREEAQSGLRKLESLGIPNSMDLSLQVQYRYEHPGTNLNLGQKAISELRAISFNYNSSGRKERTLNAYQIFLWRGFWYLLGEDLHDGNVKIFKLARIVGEISVSSKSKTYEIPENLDLSKYISSYAPDRGVAQIAIMIGEAQVLRNLSVFISTVGDEDFFEIPFDNESELFSKILWHGSSVRLISPPELVNSLITKLEAAFDV